jgi:hypothetical protein
VIEVWPGGRRRIDRVLAPGFLDGLSERPLHEVRSLRDDVAQEETDLSYLRRLLHARIDMVKAERRRRVEGGGSVVDTLASILADPARPTPAGAGRLLRLEPSRAEAHRRYVEALVADVDLSDVGSLPDEKLAEALAAYEQEERSVSDRRREVQKVMDAVNGEIVARYHAKTSLVDNLLAGERAGPVEIPAPKPAHPDPTPDQPAAGEPC